MHNPAGWDVKTSMLCTSGLSFIIHNSLNALIHGAPQDAVISRLNITCTFTQMSACKVTGQLVTKEDSAATLLVPVSLKDGRITSNFLECECQK